VKKPTALEFVPSHPEDHVWDAIVIGTGAGDATAGFNLARSRRSVLFVERVVSFRTRPMRRFLKPGWSATRRWRRFTSGLSGCTGCVARKTRSRRLDPTSSNRRLLRLGSSPFLTGFECKVNSVFDVSTCSTSARLNLRASSTAITCAVPAASANDPCTNALDRDNRAHDLDDLYVLDASFFPSTGGINRV
jgi:choline dehydrogenase-like flavoprotein